MGRKTNNQLVVSALQEALTAFLDDHRKSAVESDPVWIVDWNQKNAEERNAMSGCDCKECQLAGELRGKIF
jgi:hypothetical protein